MVDGEDWKRKKETDEWNLPGKICLDEYTSIIKAHYENVLSPVVQKNEKLDKDAVGMTKTDLEWHINDPKFEEMPFKLKRAYKSFNRLVNALSNASEEEVVKHKDVLYGLFKLGINCDSFGDEMNGIYQGRNPCRNNQYKMNSTLNKTTGEFGSSELLDAAKEMFDTCKKCPYKS